MEENQGNETIPIPVLPQRVQTENETIPIPVLPQRIQTENTSPDFVLIWDKTSKVAMSPDGFQRRSIFELNLQEEGLLLDWENNDITPSLHVVKIWAPLEVLKRYSEILRLRLPIKQIPDCEEVKPRLSDRSDAFIALFNFCSRMRKCISVDPEVFPPKCRKLTEIYSRDKEYLFDVSESNMDEIFPISIRARVVQFILKRTAYKSKAELELDAFGFGYERLIQKQYYSAAYPLHDGQITTKDSTRNILYLHWARLSQCFKHQPLDEIKSYCGVNIALYFTWLGYYTTMLVYAAVLGLICFFYGLISIINDPLVMDVCSTAQEYKMCPLCDHTCSYWKLSEKCGYSKISHLFDNDFTVAFALLMSVWTAFFLEFWKRYVATIAHQWDLTNFDLKDYTPRPEYIAALKEMFPAGTGGTEGEDEKKRYDFDLRIPFWKRRLPFSMFSYSTVLFLVFLAVAVLVGVIVYRIWITLFLSELYSGPNTGEHDLAWLPLVVSISAAFLNLTFIMLFGRIYQRLAERLTEMEFPRTPQEFEASYSLKIYLLEFMNNYSSIFYVAFFKGAFTGAPNRYIRVFGKLRQEELAVIMIGKQAKSMIFEAFVPVARRFINRASQRLKVATTPTDDTLAPSRKASKSALPQWARDYDLLQWGTYSLTDEYLEMVLQFGFLTIFVSAFPLAPLFALINNIFELRVDATKMLTHYRRPVGIRVKDIGVWSDIINGIVKVSVISNACIIAMTSSFIPKFMYRYFLLDQTDPRYGTLKGYLNNSLTSFKTAHFENDTKPNPDVLLRTGDSNTDSCYFSTYRVNRGGSNYEFTETHWKIWLARVVFVLLYENIVAVMILILCWIIPDMPGKLRDQIQREQRLVNELIIKQELIRSQARNHENQQDQPTNIDNNNYNHKPSNFPNS
ncbi:unnamed protein product [Orchesella dallaii]|uniref:Anoctamin n=1 Tax=Orchesella dallaii TaxID=48710 RepID=A0ABP1Q5Z3_9HEXA